MKGPCAKQVVRATIITPDGERFYGENDCLNAQQVCPRADMPSGVGYELCETVCRQTAHAEINALRAADSKAVGATLYLEGHTYICSHCMNACVNRGIVRTVIGPPPKRVCE